MTRQIIIFPISYGPKKYGLCLSCSGDGLLWQRMSMRCIGCAPYRYMHIFQIQVQGIQDTDGLCSDFLTNSITRQDRKSTRLNSSHVANSYADFCLKKKHKTGITTNTKSNTLNNY